MKIFFRNILLLSLVLLSGVVRGQNPAQWTVQSEQLSKDTFALRFSAQIESGWQMYGIGDYGDYVISTSVDFESGDSFELVEGLVSLTSPNVKHDATIAQDVEYYRDSVVLQQVVKLTRASAKVNATLNWMLCSDTSCTPPSQEDFTFELGSNVRVLEDRSLATSKNLWVLIIEAILWGFAALLTPCVFPMVPMTMSYFLKSNHSISKGRVMAGMYGFFIVVLYTLPIAVIILITWIFGGDAITADIFNWLATHWIPNILFFLIFLVFAASFFGAFEINLPSKLVNKSDDKSSKSGLSGVFFMALTLVIVSFSCTGPIVGSVLIKSTSGEFWEPIVTMLAFSAAFALPFIVFAFFPSLLKNVPKSGGWLASVKISLGFVELALGLKFLSIADQTYNWGILDREIYLALWIVIFTLLGLFLIGKLKFKNHNEFESLNIARLFLSIAIFSFVVYMIPGMFGAPLNALSGYLPPKHTQDFVLSQSSSAPATDSSLQEQPRKYSDFLHLKTGLDGFFTLEEGEEYAKKHNKPLLIYFTGHACVNCRVMSSKVWSDDRVLEILSKQYVIVALYLDSKKTLPESEWIITDTGKELKTLGRINSYIANTSYKVSSQPTYIVADNEGKPLLEPRGYNLNVGEYVNFLKQGVKAYYNENK